LGSLGQVDTREVALPSVARPWQPYSED
jgi:hypothetical protein